MARLYSRLAALAMFAGTLSACCHAQHAAEEAAAAEPPAATTPACPPATYDAALACLEGFLTDEERAELAGLAYDDVITTHFGLGRRIRNAWLHDETTGLAASMQALGFQHMDDMSTTLIEAYWAELNGCTVDVEAYVAAFDLYWDQLRREADGEPLLAITEDQVPRPDCGGVRRIRVR